MVRPNGRHSGGESGRLNSTLFTVSVGQRRLSYRQTAVGTCGGTGDKRRQASGTSGLGSIGVDDDGRGALGGFELLRIQTVPPFVGEDFTATINVVTRDRE